ncbi:MAG: hypothetical protein AABY22_10585 [Nanoarchaeota archaeon]
MFLTDQNGYFIIKHNLKATLRVENGFDSKSLEIVHMELDYEKAKRWIEANFKLLEENQNFYIVEANIVNIRNKES